jgi:hypothetical protein
LINLGLRISRHLWSFGLSLSFDEAISEEMTGPERPWENIHHTSYFLPELKRKEIGEFVTTMNGDTPCPVNPLDMHIIYEEGNMEIIAETIPIDIYRTHGVMENTFIGEDCSLEEIHIYTDLFKEFHNVFSWSYEDILGIDPCIIEHEITTYPDVKPSRHKLLPVNPHKTTMIKVEVDKLIKDGFIYPMQLKEWSVKPCACQHKPRYDPHVYGLS